MKRSVQLSQNISWSLLHKDNADNVKKKGVLSQEIVYNIDFKILSCECWGNLTHPAKQ